MTPIQDKSELATAFAQPRAFLFLWVNWSGQARHAQTVVEKVLASWQAEHPDELVPCYLVDVSEQSGDVWDELLKWLTDEGRPADSLMLGGVGSLLWLRTGHVVVHVVAPLRYGDAKLAALSRSVFAADAEVDVGRTN